jgi:hypothetical protein
MLFKYSSSGIRLKVLKDIYLGETIYVVANGPSLLKTDLELLIDHPSIGMNKIHLIFDKVRWRPNFVIINNPVVVKQLANVISGLSIQYFIEWKNFPLLMLKNFKNVLFFNQSIDHTINPDPVAGFGSSATVTVSAIQMALYMGAKKIVLVGVDHNFSYSGLPNTYQMARGVDINHFDPNYFSSGSIWATPDLEQSELDYLRCKLYCESNGVEIINATEGGKLEIFKKLSLLSCINS